MLGQYRKHPKTLPGSCLALNNMNMNLSFNKSSCQMLVLLQGGVQVFFVSNIFISELTKADLLLSLRLNHCLEILAWQYWQHPSAGPLVWERHPTGQLCPVHSCRGSAAPQVQGRLFPHPMVLKQDYQRSLQSPAGSSFCLDA